MSRHATGMPFVDAQADFRAARRAYRLARIGRRLARQPNGARPLTRADAAVSAEGPARLEVVPLRRIVGTLEPTGDFDARLRPASDLAHERWERIALAHRKGVPLPPIAVEAGPDGYYVIDGRHRVSVARALGESDIDAWVAGPRAAQPPAATPSAALIPAMIAPPTVTDTNELPKLVRKNTERSAASTTSSTATTTTATTIAT
jgi:hypothetical protein